MGAALLELQQNIGPMCTCGTNPIVIYKMELSKGKTLTMLQSNEGTVNKY